MTLVEKLVQLQRELDQTELVVRVARELAERFRTAGLTLAPDEPRLRSSDADFRASIEYQVESSKIDFKLDVRIGWETSFDEVEGEVDPRFRLIVEEVLDHLNPDFRLAREERDDREGPWYEYYDQALLEIKSLPVVVERYSHHD